MVQSGVQQKSDDNIDENLRRVFDDAVDVGLPDQFRTLLDAIRQQEQATGTCDRLSGD